MKAENRLSVAVLGAGLIGVDLAARVGRSDVLDCKLVVGRADNSQGLRQARSLGIATAAEGIDSLVDFRGPLDLVFDASNAVSHAEHAARLGPLDIMVVDLTPSRVGHMIAPTVNGADVSSHRNISMVTCGGQVAIPILYRVAQGHQVDYVEVVTTAASLSVGHSTRLNLDEYIYTTQAAIRAFTGIDTVKAMLNLSPARPPSTFRVAMSLIGPKLTEIAIRRSVDLAVHEIQTFASGVRLAAFSVDGNRTFISIEVAAVGGRIPTYAGNLDIINSAAIRVAEGYAALRNSIAGAEGP
ncbi:acetaldehyde dehydrogenase (acetylating) [Micromonospora sp. NPDC005172]|uniref:acetylating acetaldehyde dehydrogenase n=1 Tax=Micromonospora sp. NPDC005172 TaxID=3156867 RepID=UPI0033B3D4B1